MSGIRLTAALAACLIVAPAPAWPRPQTASSPAPAGPPPAVAPAEGYGAGSRGGAGGRTLWVTSLEDAGPGTLRQALMAEGPRIVRFRTGGTIRLDRRILVRQGRITLDGRDAAPWGGITVASAGTSGAEGGVMFMEAKDIIVRHVRFRGGYDPLSFLSCRRALVEHVSLSRAVDENFGTWDSRDITVQWSIMSEGLAQGGHPKGEHSMGVILGGGSRRHTLHHNLLIANQDRNPLVYGPTRPGRWPRRYRFDVVNNVVADYGQAMKLRFEVDVNVLGNVFLPGPSTRPGRAALQITADPGRLPRVYLDGNAGPGVEHRWGVTVWSGEHPYSHERYLEQVTGARPLLRQRPFRAPLPRREQAADAARRVLAEAGAWPRDDDDRRLLEQAAALLAAAEAAGL